jgi:hypothetical protein
MSRVRKSKLKTSTVSIPVDPEWLTAEQNAVIAIQFIKQFLFIRGQLPSLYDALLAEEQKEILSLSSGNARGTRQRRTRDQRRRATFLAQAEEVFTGLTSSTIFSSTEETSIYLLLGPSTSAPREVYELVFPPVAQQSTHHSAGCSQDDGENEDHNISAQNMLEPVLQARCRQIMRDYMMQAFDLPEGTAPDRRCKIFILATAHGAEASRSFKLRRDFQLKKGVHTQIILNQGLFDDSRPYEMPRQAILQSTAKLQGLVQPVKSG